ncbi:MAG: ABC transporter permease [Lachnospiraceae bacterium]|jgi:putative ABC transport system permease protein|nr:ABC transporter permease [Lachnospiraceae bacterium]
MWKDYSGSYIKNNRASSISIMAAALVATMFLSLLCSIAYNFWVYEIEQIILEEGGWQGRIVCETLDSDDLSMICQFANVEKAVAGEEFSQKEETVVDVYFKNARTVYRDMPLIAAQLGLNEDSIQYNSLLLSRFFVHDPEDEAPPMLLALYAAILIIAAASLILIIRGSFELSMNARIHQFGIFSSIGATPRQIRTCLLQEAVVLSILPMLLGSMFGILISYGVIKAVNFFAVDVSGRHEAVFQYHPSIFVVTVFISFLTVIFSAWIPARKLSRMTPLEAIRNTSGLFLKKKKHSRMLSYIFGMKGELAGNALKAQKKQLRISFVSLLLSFLGFSIMICFTTLADISTRYTYFERYQDAWDIMITLKDTEIPDFGLTDELQNVSGIQDVTVYQKAEAMTFLSEGLQSDELSSLGGLEPVAGTKKADGQFRVAVPVVVLDDTSFLDFCLQIGITPSLDGAIVLNQIWDSINSNFRYKEYVPFVREDNRTTIFYKNDETVEVPVLSYTQAAPALREEYDNYTLVHFIPLTMWNETLREVCETESDSYIRIFSSGTANLADLSRLEQEIVQLVSGQYEVESENRVQERLSNDNLIQGMVIILGAFCVLLAIIGIANVFLNTLGFLRQRKREFARYMSIGLTPQEMSNMFCIEAFVIAGKPLLITLPLTVLFVQFAVTASYLDPMVFWSEAPILPVLIFAAAVVLFVALAYYIGGKRLLQCDLNETLRNDTLV